MRSRFVATHPSSYYDKCLAVRDRIVALAQRFAPADRYVLHDYGYASPEECRSYLPGIEGNFAYSKWGSLFERDRSAILDDCDEVTISGHLFGVCHRDTFRSLMAGSVKDLTINVPLHATSVRVSGVPASEFAPIVRKPSLEHLNACYKLHELPITPYERAVVAFAACYVDAGIAFSPDAAVEFMVDGHAVLETRRKRRRKVVVDFQLAA